MLNRAALWLGWLWLGFSACVTVVYRAYSQSLTVDEAYVFKDFLNQDAWGLFRRYDASYHVLHTWAQWLCVHLLGSSEFVIRLPSVAGGLAYLAGVAILCRRLLGDGWNHAWKWTCGVVLLTANPHIADYLSAGRGYGSALALYVWGLIALLDRRERRAGILLALSVACNLTFLFPVAASVAIFIGLETARVKAIVRLAIPFLAVAVPILAVPLGHAKMTDFYYGSPDLGTAIKTLLLPSVLYSGDPRPEWLRLIQIVGGFALLGSLFLGGAMAAWRRDNRAVLMAGSLAATFAILIAAHGLFGVLYPWSRTGLYLTWLFLASCLAMWELPGFRIPFAAVSVLFAALFLTQFDTRYYYDFRSDADMNRIMRLLEQQPRTGKACVGGSWELEHGVFYYRLRYGMDWLEPMTRTDQPEPGCGYYILNGGDFHYVKDLGLRLVWLSPVSFTSLAVAP